MTTYTLKAIIEPDEDRWRAYCPALVDRAARLGARPARRPSPTWKRSSRWVVASMVAHGEPVVLTLPPVLSRGEPPAPELAGNGVGHGDLSRR